MSTFARRALSGPLAALLLATQLGCGTILYPERRGQAAGRIDAGVAVLDGIGLLLFLVPGVVAFAVDFATGTIYLPSGKRSSLSHDDLDTILSAVEADTGRPIDPAALQVRRLPPGQDPAAALPHPG